MNPFSSTFCSFNILKRKGDKIDILQKKRGPK